MALHENFRDYTKEEIIRIKETVCMKHNCPYFQRVHDYAGKTKSQMTATHKICNYICMTGRMRGCMPDECTHWKDKDVKKKRTFASDDGTYF